MNFVFNQDIVQLLWLFLIVICGIPPLIFLYIFIVLAYVWLSEKGKTLTKLCNGLFRVVEKLDVEKRKDICGLTITLFILILSSIANFALGLDYFNNTEINFSYLKALQGNSKAVEIYYIFGTLFLIICYICALLEPKKSIHNDDEHTKLRIKRLNLSINFFLIFNLILTPISILILITQPLSLHYIISKVEFLGMLNTPVNKLPFLYFGAILVEIPLAILSVLLVSFNLGFVLVAALFSLWLLVMKLMHYDND